MISCLHYMSIHCKFSSLSDQTSLECCDTRWHPQNKQTLHHHHSNFIHLILIKILWSQVHWTFVSAPALACKVLLDPINIECWARGRRSKMESWKCREEPLHSYSSPPACDQDTVVCTGWSDNTRQSWSGYCDGVDTDLTWPWSSALMSSRALTHPHYLLILSLLWLQIIDNEPPL